MNTTRFLTLLIIAMPCWATADVVIGESGTSCAQDGACTNRFHPDIPMVASAEPGERIVMKGKNARDLQLVSTDQAAADRFASAGPSGIAHPLVGPVFINGAEPGDVLAVTIETIDPGPIGWTSASPFGFAAGAVGIESRFILWRLNDDYAQTDALPGIRVPNASFPGVIATLPDEAMLGRMLEREAQLAEAGGAVLLPDTDSAQPSSLCGEEGSKPGECLRTIPPRENGGNMDIRYLKVGTTVYLPCNVQGCGLSIGDFHYAQGDGEVSGTAIEMDADITVTTRIVRDGPDLSHGPHYEGPASLLSIPSTRFYATTGYPLKAVGEVPPDIAYLANAKVADLPNLSRDLNLAAQNALVAMIDYIVDRYGYDRTQAYMIASVAVDLRIAQLVDIPNVGVTAILPLDIFID
jgi:formamidase